MSVLGGWLGPHLRESTSCAMRSRSMNSVSVTPCRTGSHLIKWYPYGVSLSIQIDDIKPRLICTRSITISVSQIYTTHNQTYHPSPSFHYTSIQPSSYPPLSPLSTHPTSKTRSSPELSPCPPSLRQHF